MKPTHGCRIAGQALLALTLTTGCQSAMSSSDAGSAPGNLPPGHYSNADMEWPLKFRAHYFSAFSYSTYGCKVVYGNRVRVDESNDELQIASASLGSKYPNNLSASWGPIGNFPPPAQVTWRSRDGVAHEAEVDIGAIFKDQLVRHNLSKEEISPDGPGPGRLPSIILEVNDRTINVYMRAHISTRALQTPGNKYSGFRDDLIKVYSRTY